VCESQVLWRIFESVIEEVTEDWRKTRNDYLILFA
jgi:hypothetical protein